MKDCAGVVKRTHDEESHHTESRVFLLPVRQLFADQARARCDGHRVRREPPAGAVHRDAAGEPGLFAAVLRPRLAHAPVDFPAVGVRVRGADAGRIRRAVRRRPAIRAGARRCFLRLGQHLQPADHFRVLEFHGRHLFAAPGETVVRLHRGRRYAGRHCRPGGCNTARDTHRQQQPVVDRRRRLRRGGCAGAHAGPREGAAAGGRRRSAAQQCRASAVRESLRWIPAAAAIPVPVVARVVPAADDLDLDDRLFPARRTDHPRLPEQGSAHAGVWLDRSRGQQLRPADPAIRHRTADRPLRCRARIAAQSHHHDPGFSRDRFFAGAAGAGGHADPAARGRVRDRQARPRDAVHRRRPTEPL